MKRYPSTYRNLYTILPILLMLVMGTSPVHGQQAGQQHPLLGSWSFDYPAALTKMEASNRTQLDTIPQFRIQVESAYVGRRIFFGSDGSYQQLLANGHSAFGTWILGPNNTILITDPRGTVHQQQIAVLTDQRLVLLPITTGEGKSMFPEFHFIKN